MERGSILQWIGNTPIVKLMDSDIWVKLEYLNPTGSIKDRIALKMIEDAESKGNLKEGDTLVEPTSGNTGISFSFVAARKGYKMVVVMPDSATQERVQLIRAFGAEVVLTPAEEHNLGSLKRALAISKETGALMLNQFANPANVRAHEETGKEALGQAGPFDAIVAGVGTGGTLMGAGKALRQANPNTKVIAVEPAEAPILSTGRGGAHGIAGISDGFVPPIFDLGLVDQIAQITTEEARSMARQLAAQEGIFGGVSTGANIAAAMKLKEVGRILTFAPDSGMRYLSTGLYEK